MTTVSATTTAPLLLVSQRSGPVNPDLMERWSDLERNDTKTIGTGQLRELWNLCREGNDDDKQWLRAKVLEHEAKRKGQKGDGYESKSAELLGLLSLIKGPEGTGLGTAAPAAAAAPAPAQPNSSLRRVWDDFTSSGRGGSDALGPKQLEKCMAAATSEGDREWLRAQLRGRKVENTAQVHEKAIQSDSWVKSGQPNAQLVTAWSQCINSKKIGPSEWGKCVTAAQGDPAAMEWLGKQTAGRKFEDGFEPFRDFSSVIG